MYEQKKWSKSERESGLELPGAAGNGEGMLLSNETEKFWRWLHSYETQVMPQMQRAQPQIHFLAESWFNPQQWDEAKQDQIKTVTSMFCNFYNNQKKNLKPCKCKIVANKF